MDELADIKRLAGIGNSAKLNEYTGINNDSSKLIEYIGYDPTVTQPNRTHVSMSSLISIFIK